MPSVPSAKSRSPDSFILLGNAQLDTHARSLTVDGHEVPLRTKEFDLLAALAARPGVVHTREQLLDSIWGLDIAGDTRTIDVHISRLREKLASAGITATIDTIRSIGYRLSQ